MIDSKDIHLSLDEAREELKNRWDDAKLKAAIIEELEDKFMPMFTSSPCAVSFRQVCSPDNGFVFFYQCARYIDVEPLVLEYHDDMFVSFNEEKKGMGRLRVTLEDGTKATADIMNFHENEKKKLGDVIIKTGEKLVDFHRELFKVSGYDIELMNNSRWLNNFGRASEYYYHFLLHFVAHGVLFANYESHNDDGSEAIFMKDIINPALQKIEKKFGLKPLVIRAFSQYQNDNEDFYWWSYPPNMNKYIIDYVKENKLSFVKQ